MPSRRSLPRQVMCPSCTEVRPRAASWPQPVWSQLDAARREQMAQHLATLIRRMCQQTVNAEGNDHEQP